MEFQTSLVREVKKVKLVRRASEVRLVQLVRQGRQDRKDCVVLSESPETSALRSRRRRERREVSSRTRWQKFTSALSGWSRSKRSRAGYLAHGPFRGPLSPCGHPTRPWHVTRATGSAQWFDGTSVDGTGVVVQSGYERGLKRVIEKKKTPAIFSGQSRSIFPNEGNQKWPKST